jgi:hypothetical protein
MDEKRKVRDGKVMNGEPTIEGALLYSTTLESVYPEFRAMHASPYYCIFAR